MKKCDNYLEFFHQKMAKSYAKHSAKIADKFFRRGGYKGMPLSQGLLLPCAMLFSLCLIENKNTSYFTLTLEKYYDGDG
jgi:hypothetical protein